MGTGLGVTTLDTLIDMGEFIAPSVPIRQVMDPLNRKGDGILCYDYERTKS
jgi:tyrosinase